MYSDQVKEAQNIEINIHPISKWRRILLYLGDMLISFILAVIVMNLIVMPIASLVNTTDSKRSYEAEKLRDEILYENNLLFYRDEPVGNYPKYNFNKNLTYTCYRFIAYYVFPDTTTLDSRYPEYCHLPENEVIWTYYHTIRSDDVTYYKTFEEINNQYKHFEINGTNISLKQEIIDEIRVFYKPNEALGKKGKTYFSHLESLFTSLYGRAMKDVYKNDLTDSHGNSYNECQKIMREVSSNFYWKVSICSIISFLVSWGITHLLYPLINKQGHTITASIMKVDRLGFRNLYPLNKGEVAITAIYYLLFDLPYIFFLSLSYTTFIYAFNVPMLPILTLISFVMVLASLFVILFNTFNRSIIDLLSQTVNVPTEEVDGIIKAKETLKEIQMAERRKKDNG